MEAPGIVATHLVVGAGAMAIAFLLFTRGAFGGGDAKFLAALSTWMEPAHIPGFSALTAVLRTRQPFACWPCEY